MSEKIVMDFKSYQITLSEKQRELLEGVEHGTLTTVQNLAKQLSTLIKNDELFSYILLTTALRREHKTMIKFFIKENCHVKISQKTGYYCTPLYYAVEMYDQEIFRTLWKRGASMFETDANNISALALAMKLQRSDIIDFILNERIVHTTVKVLNQDHEDDVALFHATCWNGNSRAIQLFMSCEFSLKSRSNFEEDEWKGFTPLHFAIENIPMFHSADLIALLLLKHNEIDIIAKDERGRTPLHLAFRNGLGHILENEIILESMIRSNEKHCVNAKDNLGLSLFHIFCSLKPHHGDAMKLTILIKSFIDNGADVNESVSFEDESYSGFTALMFAIKESSWKVFKLLLEYGADPTKANKDKLTPLHLVCKCTEINRGKRFEIVKLLLQHGGDSIALDTKDCTPLHSLFYTIHFKEFLLDPSKKLLFANNPQWINHTDKNGISFLHMACIDGDLAVVQSLVDGGAQINSCILSNSPQYSGYSPLHMAVKFNQVEIVEFLLAHGANVNCNTVGDGWYEKTTALHMACDHYGAEQAFLMHEQYLNNDDIKWVISRTDHIRIVELLIKYEAPIDAKNASGQTPLMRNCYIPSFLRLPNFIENQRLSKKILNEVLIRQKYILNLLLDHGADINAQGMLENNFLLILTKNKENYCFNKDLIELGLTRGANIIDASGIGKFTLLHVAVKHSLESALDTSLIDLLLKYGANINAKDNHLNTPLHVAAQSHHYLEAHRNILAKLLDHPGINMNIRNDRGRTPLFVSIDKGNHFCTETLLKCGSDINIEDRVGHSPTHALLKCLARVPTLIKDDQEFHDHVTIVVTHIKELERLKLRISDKVKNDFVALMRNLPEKDLAAMDLEINEELEFFESQNVDSYTSFKDILFKDSNALAKHVQNRDFQDVILSMRSKCDYSFFSNFIRKQYDRGCRRSKILEPAKTALCHISHVIWPDSCSERILSYLDNGNVINFIKSTNRIYENKLKNPVRPKQSSSKKPRLHK